MEGKYIFFSFVVMNHIWFGCFYCRLVTGSRADKNLVHHMIICKSNQVLQYQGDELLQGVC